MLPESPLLFVHAFASVFMTGLIWVIQLVHYPLMARVGVDGYAAYQREHMRRITWIVGPMMLLEGAAAVLLLVDSAAVPRWMTGAGAALLVVIWASTTMIQGPTHMRLLARYDERLMALLVTSNWVRTIAWTARGVIAMAMVYPGIPN